jgi:hypothetical protein
MASRKKRTPEEIAAEREFRRNTEEFLRNLWRYLDAEWDKLEERYAREGREPRVPRPKKPIWG